MNRKLNHFFIAGKLALCFLLFVPITLRGSTNVNFSPQPTWVDSVDWKAPGQIQRDPNSNGTRYLLFERQMNRETREEFVRIILLMENESGLQDSGSLTFGFDPSFQELSIHRIQIHRKGQLLNQLDPTRARQMMAGMCAVISVRTPHI